MNEFWTSKKLGKHPNLAKQAELLYEHYAMCSAEKLLARLLQSTFEFGNYGPIAWANILEEANLDDCLKQEYVEEALKVTTARPAIGKGEFLFVSIFKNVGFAKEKGDLIDINTNERIEVKGDYSVISNGNSKNFFTLDQRRLNALCNLLHISPIHTINASTCQSIKQVIGIDFKLATQVLTMLRNTVYEYKEVIDEAVNFYKNSKRLLLTIAAMHLYSYMYLEKSNYLLAVNNDKFMCFDKPKSFVETAEILKHFELHEWKIGESGIKVSLKNE